MHISSKLLCTAVLTFFTLSGIYAAAATPSEADKDRVLHQLDVASQKFRSISAEFQFDSIETDPIPDKDVQKGTVYYERKGTATQMAAHINIQNNKPAPKDYSFTNGAFKLFEPGPNQVTTFARAGKFEKYLMLGFGASGKELTEQWDVTYLGPETLPDGSKTEKLELVAKDPAVRKNLNHVTIWIDPDTAISHKQVFSEDSSHYRVCVYFNIKMNQTLPKDAFTFKTDKKTQYVDR